jgi:putative endonuclease
MFKVVANTKTLGDAAETRALAWLVARGLRLVQRNYRVAKGPGAAGGEIDLIMRDSAGTLVFVEVRSRRSSAQGGAAASVTAAKRARIVRTAQHFLARQASMPACRFDVVTIDGERIEWLPAAFDAD